MHPLNTVSALPAPSQLNHFQKLYDHVYNSCAQFLPFKDRAILSRTCWKSTHHADAARADVRDLDLVDRKITDLALVYALGQYPNIHRLRLVNPDLSEEGIAELGEFFEGKAMLSLVLINCTCLLDYPRQAKALIRKINFIALEHFAISSSKDFARDKNYVHREDAHSAFMQECTQPLVAKLKSSRSLKTLDLTLLKPSDQESITLLQSFPPTLEHFGPLPGRFSYFPGNFTTNTDEQVAIAMERIRAQNIQRCDLSNRGMSAEKCIAALNYLPSGKISQIILPSGNPPLDLNNHILNALVIKLTNCERLTSLRVQLLPGQLLRLIPALPPTLTELYEWAITSDELANCLIAKKFQHLHSCKLSFKNISSGTMRLLLAALSLANLHEISFSGLMHCLDPSALAYFLEQISLNSELRKLYLSLFELGIANRSFPNLLDSIRSEKLESLIIRGVTSDKKDRYNKRNRTILLLKEKIHQWPKIKQLIIEDERTHYWNLIELKAVQGDEPFSLESKANSLLDMFGF